MKKRITLIVICMLLAGTMVTVTAFANDVSSGQDRSQVFANMARGVDITPDGQKYGIAVVNPGESYIYDNSSWHDWSEYMKSEDIKKVRTKYTKKLAYSKKAKKVPKLSPKTKGGAKISFSISSIKKGSKKIRSGFTVTSKGVVKS